MNLTDKSVKVAVCFLVMLVLAAGVQAQLVMVEDFEAYTAGDSIHLMGQDDLGFGDPVPRWYVQRNSSVLGDPGWVTVETVDGDKCLQLINRDLDGEIDTIYLSMSISEFAIEAQGTIYLRFKADGPNDTILCTNDLAPGYDYDGTGAASIADGFQGMANYSAQGAMLRLSGDDPFRARNGDAYEFGDQVLAADTWYELWIHHDAVSSQSRYYVAPEGMALQVVLNEAGGEWWVDRNLDAVGVYNLKWIIGMYPWPEANVQTTVWIDSIAIDPDSFAWPWWSPPPRLPGDANEDGVVDLDDFVLLKHNFGHGDEWAEGDFDEDGDVDLDDFVILKHNFGATGDPNDCCAQCD